jgi:hypothetical protein
VRRSGFASGERRQHVGGRHVEADLPAHQLDHQIDLPP